MRKSFLKALALISACSLILNMTPAASYAAPAAQQPPPTIQLEVGTFTPGQTALPLDPELTLGALPAGQPAYYLVQFAGPVQGAWKAAVQATGAQLLEYIPDNAFVIRMTPEQANQVKGQANVRFVDPYQPGYKFNLALDAGTAKTYTVMVHPGADARAVAQALIAQNIPVLSRQNEVLVVSANGPQVKAIAKVSDVAWIEEKLPDQALNDYGGGVIVGANTVQTNGYTGQNQVIAVADTGLDRGDKIEEFPDIPNRRIREIFNWPGVINNNCVASIVDDGTQDVDGHGTHVAVSALGAGLAGANGIGRGVAPEAELVFQAVQNYVVMKAECGGSAESQYRFIGLPNDTRELFRQAYQAGARIHNNSWGADVNGAYTANAAQVDHFMHQIPDMTIVFAAGNAGVDRNGDGIIDDRSINSPGSAKNVITVGASENARTDGFPCDNNLSYKDSGTDQTCAEMGGRNLITPWLVWGFTAGPLRNDPSAGNAEQMAGFSSRGPTRDGRIKPDVVAPGTWILSGYSDMYQQGYNNDPINPQNNEYQGDGWGLPYSEHYKYNGGTSMASPIVAGAAAIVREFYQEAHTVTPSSALIKATLINSAVDLLDENNDGVNDNRFPIPNVHEGWGRINLVNATDKTNQFVDDPTGVATGNVTRYSYTIPGGGGPLKITLVWNDAPGNPMAGPDLVNNLDLVVTSPEAVTYIGNHFGGGWTLQGGGQADRTNNVENVYIQTAAPGIWTVEVRGTNVPVSPNPNLPGGTQPFALVVDYQGASDNCVITGDINCDRTVNIVDLQVLINMILRSDNPDFTLYPREWWTRGDLNRDNTWNIVDLQQVINIIIG
jgi:subtilisin family serine protease